MKGVLFLGTPQLQAAADWRESFDRICAAMLEPSVKAGLVSSTDRIYGTLSQVCQDFAAISAKLNIATVYEQSAIPVSHSV